MRDGISLASAGHPVVVFVHDHFERAARAHARGLGVPDLRFYVFSPAKPGSPSTFETEQASRAADAFPQLLLASGN